MCSGTIPSEQPLTYHTESYESYLSFFFSWSVNLCSPKSSRHVQPLKDQGHLYGTAVDDLQLSDFQYSGNTSVNLRMLNTFIIIIKFKTIIKDIKDDWSTLKVSKVCDSPHSSMDTSFTTRFASSICHLPGSARPLVEEILHWFSQSASTPEPPGIAIAAATDAVGHCRTTTGASGWPKSRSHCRSSAICPSSLRESS